MRVDFFLCLAAAILLYSNSAFSDDGATWVDSKTGLMWYKCYYGQSYVDGGCRGEPIKANWHDVMSSLRSNNNNLAETHKSTIEQHKDWRLPTPDEFLSFRSQKELKNSESLEVWSSVSDGYNAWYIQPDSNIPNVCSQTDENYAVLVRAGSKDYYDSQNKIHENSWQSKVAAQLKEMDRVAAEGAAKRRAERLIQLEIAARQEKARQKREESLPPQGMYLLAGKYDRNGQRSDAVRLYEILVDKYADHPLAIQASNRLVSMQSDLEAASRLREENNRSVDMANQRQAQSSAECRRRKQSYKYSCGDDWKCYERASSICSE